MTRGVSSLRLGTIAGLRTCRQDDAIEGQTLFTAAGLRNSQRIRILEGCASLDIFDLALLRKHAQAAGQLLDHALFPRAQSGQINLGIGVLDPPIFGVSRFVNQLGHVQQGL